MPRRPRLIDLHCAWPVQYAAETTQYDASQYGEVAARLGQVEGYLGATRAAVVVLGGRTEDWSRQADPWGTLGAMLARVEAEFCGRLLMAPADLSRWGDDAEALCWAAVAVAGFGALVRSPADLDRLAGLFERGVRVFQPIAVAASGLGGSSADERDEGLTELGRAFLAVLADLASDGPGPRPALDLAGMGRRTMADVLDWFEADAHRAARLVPIFSHGALGREGRLPPPSVIAHEPLTRLRSLGGVVGLSVGPPSVENAEELAVQIDEIAAIPFAGRTGIDGIAFGTGFLAIDHGAPGLDDAEAVVRWAFTRFDRAMAESLVWRTGTRLLDRLAGGDDNNPIPSS